MSHRNYLLAQAHVDASALANSIAHLNAQSTFSPLQALQDTDVAGYLRHAHEQNLISTIEEGRRETQEEFYRALEDRGRRDWEARKKRVFEQLGARVGGENRAVTELKKSAHGRSLLSVSIQCINCPDKRRTWRRILCQSKAARLRLNHYLFRQALVPVRTSRCRAR